MIPVPLQNLLDRLTVAWHERAVALKAASFAMVGVVNTAIDFSVFWTTVYFLGWPLVPDNVLAWLVAVSFSYVMNSFITFGPESGRVLRWRDYATFLASGVAGGEADIDRDQFRGQLLTVPFRGIPRAPSAVKHTLS